MRSPGTQEQPLRVAIVGSGPSGSYVAGHLLNSRSHPDLEVEVDVFDRLPTPWGLVRGGVAPDHPNIKAVSRVYEKTARHPGFRFYGNIGYGTEVTHDDLHVHYHAVVYAVGAQTDRRMGIEGEDLPGSWAATELVGWYNGHPDYRQLEFDFSCQRAVVIGNGNVAADVARMLTLPHAELAQTDVADHALAALAESRIEEVVVLGRRGPAQAAFTNPELLELGAITDVDVVVDPREVELDPLSREWLESGAAGTVARKNVEILKEYASRAPQGKRRRIVLRFLVSPIALLGDERLEGIRICRNELRDEGDSLRACSTDATETIDCGVVFRSIGYRGVPLEGLPFDELTGTVPNEEGRVVGEDGTRRRGDYVVGWIKRGPTGIIGTNKRDAQQTVDALLADLEAGDFVAPAEPSREALEELLAERSPHHVSYAGWEAIDRREREAGEPHGRPRVKLTTTEELLDAARERVG
jgi:ferredoxin--NADP+ reductase